MGHPDDEIELQYREQMQTLARFINEFFNGKPAPGKIKHTGFFLCVFPFEGFDGRSNYISNADRRDIIVLLKEMASRFEGMPEMEGHG